jgi:Zn-dependent peptidase ImmA (M78 family)/DNA-binding XRE family transcriptional regulator
LTNIVNFASVLMEIRVAKSIPALVNPTLLAWARNQAGFSLEEVALKVKRDVKELQAWEQGERQPTLRQAEKLAKVYHCSFSTFTLQQPPSIPPLATQYRRLPGVKPGEESPELRVALRDMLYHRSVALDLLEELGETQEAFSLRVRLAEDAEVVGARIREVLNVSLQTQFEWANDSHAWRGWRSAIEAKNVLVLLFAGVDPEEVRGVSLFHPTLPVIGLNNHEVRASRPFTLLHEFVHILLSKEAEEKPALEERRPEQEWAEVERYAESVAGAVLMPEGAISDEPLVQGRRPSEDWSIPEIQKLARRYKVTPLAFATRLLALGRISPLAYRRWKNSWTEFLEDHPPKGGGGIATPAEKALNRNGIAFTTLVLEALTLERITPVDASRYLNLNYSHIEDLRLHFAFGRPLRRQQAE